ncbi:protoporphyrinogen oxidase HemJ [Roseovarius spongiae]|uniref:Protoporphyrinogen IX oxidase n=1 Tax=Roseovarius spongiae TaxID=2320272 RepID=A0A3A8ARD5_9RHOB|nr:protoporphyrinogen oxidase HemJ [Roseovarius spongiae]RKF13375.1 protoporphyrinogen oxidase HemJ [Roseovarius spongiae]
MTGILISTYPWVKALHIMAVISWMAGLFYLPRLFVYHAEQSEPEDSRDVVFQEMERKLLNVIMTPSMIATWALGLALVAVPGVVDWSDTWPWTKAAGVLAMTWFHFWLAARRRDFATGVRSVSGRRYRLMNEAPTVLMVVIVFSVVLRF